MKTALSHEYGMPFVLTAAAFLLAVFAGSLNTLPKTHASGDKPDSLVKVSATSTKPDAEGKQQITILLEIKEGHQIFANPVEMEELETEKTTVKITSSTKPESIKVEFPPGKKEMIGDQSYRVYEGKVEIKAFVKRAVGDMEPLEAIVWFHPSGRGLSWPPAAIKLQIK